MDDRAKRVEELLGEAITFASLDLIPDEQWLTEAEKFLYNQEEIWELPEFKGEELCRKCGHPKDDHTGKYIDEHGKIHWLCTLCMCECDGWMPPIDKATQLPAKA